MAENIGNHMIWKLREAPTDAGIKEWLPSLGLPGCFAAGLWSRGLQEVEAARRFLAADPELIVKPTAFGEPMERAVARLRQAFEKKEHIVVFGDYDVDGTCGAALVQEVFRKMASRYGFSSEVMLSDRFSEGYGLNANNLNRLQKKNPHLVITVDCGVSSAEEIRQLKDAGTDVIVTDHHGLKGAFPNAAFAIVHPAFAQEAVGAMSGCGVAWQLMRGLWELNGKSSPDWLRRGALDLVALGVVCDIMPLNEGHNRAIVREGMRLIEAGERTVFKVMGQSCNWKRVNTYTLGFVIGPRLNAAGRMNRTNGAMPVVECLLARDEAQCSAILADLERFNTERRQKQEEALQHGIAYIEAHRRHNWLSVVQGDFHEGVAGIVASKLAERYYQPAFVLAVSEDDSDGRILKGSARSIPSVDLFRVIEKHQQHLVHWGGHAMAAGLTIERDRAEKFFDLLDTELACLPEDVWQRVRWIDGVLQSADLTDEFFQGLVLLEPHGEGNPPFVWSLQGTVEGRVLDRVGEPKSGFIRIGENTYPFIMWEQADKCRFGVPQTFIGRWEYNDFRKTMQFQAEDVFQEPQPDEVKR